MNWYLLRSVELEPEGPFFEVELQAMWDRMEIGEEALIAKEGDEHWSDIFEALTHSGRQERDKLHALGQRLPEMRQAGVKWMKACPAPDEICDAVRLYCVQGIPVPDGDVPLPLPGCDRKRYCGCCWIAVSQSLPTASESVSPP